MITPYLVFNGNCKEAINFYKEVFDSEEPQILPYGDYMPEGSETPQELLRTWVMHGEMVACGTKVWFADESVDLKKGDTVRLTITVGLKKEAEKIFQSLSEEGEVLLPPTETFYSTFHAALKDKFGVHWNIVAEEQPLES